MIREKTVFIFGAGLSCEYGFPTNRQLRDIVTSVITEQKTLLLKRNIRDETLILFERDIKTGVFNTIDALLKQKDSEAYRDVARNVLALALIPYKESNVSEGKFDDNCFYRFLFTKMVRDSNKDTFLNNQVIFITFNYDRSFEFFMRDALEVQWNLPKHELKQILSNLNLIYLHGKLGLHTLENDNYGRESNQQSDHINLLLTSNQIKLVVDIENTTAQYDKAHKAIASARNIYFLGFGFDEECLFP